MIKFPPFVIDRLELIHSITYNPIINSYCFVCDLNTPLQDTFVFCAIQVMLLSMVKNLTFSYTEAGTGNFYQVVASVNDRLFVAEGGDLSKAFFNVCEDLQGAI